MAADGSIRIDTKLDNREFKAGSRELLQAIKSLQNSAAATGKDMRNSAASYGATMRENVRAAREFKAELKSLERETSQMRKDLDYRGNQTGAKQFMEMTKQIRRYEKAMQDAQGRADKLAERMGDGALNSKAYQKADEAVTRLASKIEDLRKKRDDLGVSDADVLNFRAQEQTVEQMEDRLRELRHVSEETGGGFRAITRSAGGAVASIARIAGTSALTFLKKLAAGAKNAAIQLAKLAKKAVVTGLKRIGQLAGGAAKKLLGLGKATRRSNGGFKAGFLTILKYGFGIRSLFFLFRRLRTAVTEGLGEIAKKNPQVKASIDTLKRSLSALKGSLATAFAPIVTAVAPALTTLINLLTKAINTVGAFFAALTGQKIYTKSVGMLDATGKSAKDASKNVKELKNQLAGFDELDILSENNSSGSGSGSDSGYGYENVPIDSAISSFVDRLKQLFAAGEYEEIGHVIADGLNQAIQKVQDFIKWDNIGPTITKILSAITGAINGLFENFDWRNLGNTIADGLNTAIYTLQLWFDGIKWEDVGKAIANALNGLFERVDWPALGRLISSKAKSLINSFKGFFENFEWGEAGTAFSEAVNAFFEDEETWAAAGKAIDAAIDGVLDFAGKFLEHFNEIQFAKDVRALLGNIDWKTIATEFWDKAKLAFTKAGNFIKVLLGGDVYDVQGNAVEQMWERGSGNASSITYSNSWVKEFAEKIGSLLASIPWKEIFNEAKRLAVEAISGFVDGLFGTEDGTFLAKFTLAIVGLKVGIPALIAGLSKAIVGSINVLGLAAVTTFKAVAANIGTSALAAFDAAMIVYDYQKISEAAEGYKQAGETYANEISKACKEYKRIYDTDGKDAADSWAKQAYNIDTTNNDLITAQQSISNEITRLWGDAPKNWKEALQQGWNEYFGSNGKGLAALLGDAGDSFMEWLGWKEPTDKGANGNYTISLKSQPVFVHEGRRNGTKEYTYGRDPSEEETTKLAKMLRLDYGYSFEEIQKALNLTAEQLKTVADLTEGFDEWGYSKNYMKSSDYNRAGFAANGGDLAGWDDAFNDNTDALNKNTKATNKGTKSTDRQTKLRSPSFVKETKTPTTVGGQIKADVALRNDWQNALNEISNADVGVTTKVSFLPLGAGGASFINNLGGFLNNVFKPGTDTNARVALQKKGWTDISSFVGTLVSVMTNLKKGNWTSIGGFVGTLVQVMTNLTKGNWTSIGGFVGTLVQVMTNLSKGNWYSLSGFIGNAVDVATNLFKGNFRSIQDFVGWFVDVATNLYRGNYRSIGDFVGHWVEILTYLTNQGSNWSQGILKWITGNVNGIITLVANLGTPTNQKAKAPSKVKPVKKAGGVYSNGVWHEIPQYSRGGIVGAAHTWYDSVAKYASGTRGVHGSLFVAGEAGPEIVGHVGGRTEVLNKSQLASTMYSAVANGMLSALSHIQFRTPAMAQGTVMPYEIAAQIALTGQEIQNTLNANNEDLIQTIISVAGQIVAAIQRAENRGAPAGGGMTAKQIINEINRQTQMFAASPLKGV